MMRLVHWKTLVSIVARGRRETQFLRVKGGVTYKVERTLKT